MATGSLLRIPVVLTPICSSASVGCTGRATASELPLLCDMIDAQKQPISPAALSVSMGSDLAGVFGRCRKNQERENNCMEFSGTQTMAVPVQKVWAFLMDVQNVARCAPGFQSLEVLGEEHWK